MESQPKGKKKVTIDLVRHGKKLTEYASGYFPKKMEDVLKKRLGEEGIEVSDEKLKKIKKSSKRRCTVK